MGCGAGEAGLLFRHPCPAVALTAKEFLNYPPPPNAQRRIEGLIGGLEMAVSNCGAD